MEGGRASSHVSFGHRVILLSSPCGQLSHWGDGVALWGQCDASEASQDGFQSMMVHADGRAEIGHHRTERDSTQALALAHAGPRMRCRTARPQPLAPKHTQSVIIGPPPLPLLPPELTSQKRNERVGTRSWCWGLWHLGVCAMCSTANGSEEMRQRPVRVRAVGITLASVCSLGRGRGRTWVLSSGVCQNWRGSLS